MNVKIMKYSFRQIVSAFCLGGMIVCSPSVAQAQCEILPMPIAAAAVIAGMQGAAVLATLSSGAVLDTLLEQSTAEALELLLGGQLAVVTGVDNQGDPIVEEETDMEFLSTLDDLGLSSIEIPIINMNLLDIITGNADVGNAIDFIGRSTDVSANYGGMAYLNESMLGRLNAFWVELHFSLQRMSEQMSASEYNTARMVSSLNDGSSMQGGAGKHQEETVNGKIQGVINTESCRFDSITRDFPRVFSTSRALSTAGVAQMRLTGMRQVGSPAAAGRSAVIQDRFDFVATTTCHADENGGQSACVGEDHVLAEASVSPDKLLFNRETIDNMQAADTRRALDELAMNIIRFDTPPIVPMAALKGQAGQELLRAIRSDITQQDALLSLVASIVGERAPAASLTAEETDRENEEDNLATKPSFDLRVKSGAVAPSETPSQREIRQAIVEQLQHQDYYTDLIDSETTIGQKELYLKAYNTIMLGQLIEKQERISTAFAIETANMLKKYRNPSLPFQQGVPIFEGGN